MAKWLMKKEKGFTVIELMVVLIILAILAAIAVPIYRNYIARSFASEAMGVIGAIIQDAKAFRMANGAWPPNNWFQESQYVDQDEINNNNVHFTYTYANAVITATGGRAGRLTNNDTITYNLTTYQWAGAGVFANFPFPNPQQQQQGTQ